MLNPVSLQLRVGVDVGSRCHSVAIGLSDGSLLEEFEIPHTAEGFQEFFARIEACVRPLDSLVRARGWRLFNVNNLKLARFKEIFPAAAKSDRIDSRKTLELFQLRDHLPMAGEVLQEVMATPAENDILKRLSRRRRRLVNERTRVLNSMQADLQAVCPGLLEMTRDVGNLWFLNFLTCRKGLLKLARVHRASLLKVQPGRRHDPAGCGATPRVETADQGLGRADGAGRPEVRHRRPARLHPGLRLHLRGRAGR
jgi:hypothetical protein